MRANARVSISHGFNVPCGGAGMRPEPGRCRCAESFSCLFGNLRDMPMLKKAVSTVIRVQRQRWQRCARGSFVWLRSRSYASSISSRIGAKALPLASQLNSGRYRRPDGDPLMPAVSRNWRFTQRNIVSDTDCQAPRRADKAAARRHADAKSSTQRPLASRTAQRCQRRCIMAPTAGTDELRFLAPHARPPQYSGVGFTTGQHHRCRRLRRNWRSYRPGLPTHVAQRVIERETLSLTLPVSVVEQDGILR